MNTISERLSYLINALSIKKKDFAASINVSNGNLSDWCSGRSKPSYNALKRIEEIYGVSLKWLTEGIGEMYVETDSIRNDEILTDQEKRIIEYFRSLSYEEKLKIEGVLEYKAAESVKQKQKSSLSQEICDVNQLA